MYLCSRHDLTVFPHDELAQVAVEGYSTVYPCNAAAAFEVDEFIDAFEDIRMKLVPTFAIADATEKAAARAALVVPGTGAVSQLLAKIEALCSKTQAGFMVGNTTTLADIWCFFFLNFLICGFWDGLPVSSVSAAQYPKLFAVVKRVASIPKVREKLALMQFLSLNHGDIAVIISFRVFVLTFEPFLFLACFVFF
jgi:glutathione S-transferase